MCHKACSLRGLRLWVQPPPAQQDEELFISNAAARGAATGPFFPFCFFNFSLATI